LAAYCLLLFRDGELTRKEERHFADDLDALDAARRLSQDYAVEVYLDNIFVARVKLGDAPLDVGDLQSG